MNDPRRPASYPPRVQRWRFADPPVSRRWFWAAVVAGPLAVVVMVGAFVVLVVLETRDAPGLIDDVEAVQVVGEECESMMSAVDGLPLSGPPSERAERLRSQNAAIELMLRAIRELDDEIIARDLPLADWLADWDRLVEAREDLATTLEDGEEGELDVPVGDDGDEIVERMDAAALLAGCEVPTSLVDPEFADSRSV